ETGRLAQIGQPSVVVTGAEDRLTPPRYAQFLADTLPDARLHLIPATGHMVMLEKPGEVAGLLKSFLDNIPGLF
ncbi:MAG: alpha/beta fold hydrolase, partial [Deltaproteobacteria bacterium]|nr:alpha/beta fold hydrolase [Deltaproteobacteria bacterium]